MRTEKSPGMFSGVSYVSKYTLASQYNAPGTSHGSIIPASALAFPRPRLLVQRRFNNATGESDASPSRPIQHEN